MSFSASHHSVRQRDASAPTETPRDSRGRVMSTRHRPAKLLEPYYEINGVRYAYDPLTPNLDPDA